MKSKATRLLIGLLALAAGARGAPSTQPAPTEGELKAAFVYNFIALAPWEATVEKVELCIVGETRWLRDLERLSGRTFGANRVVATKKTTADRLSTCNAVFISPDQSAQLDVLLKSLKRRKTLTTGDSPEFARRGVMLNLIIQDDRVRFEANAGSATEAGLPISSRLLRLAVSVF